MAYRVIVIDQTVVVPDNAPRELTREPFCFLTVARVDTPDGTFLRFGAPTSQGIPISSILAWQAVDREDGQSLWYTNPVAGGGSIFLVLSGSFRGGE